MTVSLSQALIPLRPPARRFGGVTWLLWSSLVFASGPFGCSRAAPERAAATQSSATQSAPPPAPTTVSSFRAEPRASEGGQSTEPERARTLAPPLDERGHYGAAFTGATKQSLKRVLTEPERYKDQPLTVSGIVKRVCERKGCWMELAADSAAEAARCRIRFKDYGFFVPTNSEGAKAQVEGMLMVSRVAAARVKHLEEEGAVFDSKNPDGSANETQLIATAVQLER